VILNCLGSYDGHFFVCLSASFADWPQDACSISPAKEVSDAVKAAQKTNGGGLKLKVTVCEGLDGEDGDVLFFPSKTANLGSPRVFRGAASTAGEIAAVVASIFTPTSHEAKNFEPLAGNAQVTSVCRLYHLSCRTHRYFAA
jgi:hypothetical protein